MAGNDKKLEAKNIKYKIENFNPLKLFKILFKNLSAFPFEIRHIYRGMKKKERREIL